MIDRIKYINTRNLIVCETFDDFALALSKIDSTVEDIVGYVTSLANVYYGNNIESIWGAIGFTWNPSSLTPLSREESIQYPNPLYRHTQVTANGEVIAMDDDWLYEHRLSKGTGVFNRTTIPFSHIPEVPDGHRITAITGTTLANINPSIKTLYIDKSNWVNLSNINGISSSGRTIYADLEGSTILNAAPLIGTVNGSKLYIKADLSKCTNISIFSGDLMSKSMLIGNDYYKDLDIVVGDNSIQTVSIQDNNNFTDFYRDCSIVWEGSGPFKLEYFFKFKDYNNVYVNRGYSNIWSVNGEYLLSNYKNTSDSNGLFLNLQNLKSIADKDTLIDLTIDCTNNVSDTRLDYDFAYRNNNIRNNDYFTPRLLPIKYKGNVTSIGIYNPYLKIENDEWPEFNQSLVNKLNPDLGQQILKGVNIINAKHKCPYTINASNLEHINIFNYGSITYDSSFEKDYGVSANVLPNITVDESKVYTSARFNFGVPQSSIWTFPIKKLKVISLYDKDVWQGIFFDEGTMLTATNINGSNYHTSWSVYNSEVPVVTLKKLDANANIRSVTHFNYKVTGNYADLYVIDATDSELMSNEPIDTAISFNTVEVRHPLVLCNVNLNESTALQQHYTNFRIIYRSHISQSQQYALSYNGYTDAELMAFANSFVETGNSVEYQITVKSYIYNALERLDLIGVIASKGYNVVNQL